MILANPAREDAPGFVSVDSAPLGFAVNRSPLVAPLFLLVFALISAGVLLLVPQLEPEYISSLGNVVGVNPSTSGDLGSLGFRSFFGAFMLAFWIFAAGTLIQRIKLLFSLCIAYGGAVLLVDAILLRVNDAGGPGPLSLIGNILAGYAALLAITAVILSSVRLPTGERVHTRLRRPRHHYVVLAGCITVAAALVVLILRYTGQQLEILRDVALLGGLGPGILIFSPTLASMLFIVGSFARRMKPSDIPPVSVAFLVPAFNEANDIAACIRSLDEAAANYPNPCRLYVVDNASVDGTEAAAKGELFRCRALTGKVLTCPHKGKAAALNLGLKHMTEDIVVRVDADTVVLPSLLRKLIPYFSDQAVGGVGGLPLPRNSSFLLTRMRSIEVYYNIGFQRVGQCAIDGIMVIPGILSMYRRELLTELGGFCEGLNGEDTDMTVRIGRLGYRLIIDPGVHVFSEAPRTLGHLREQRLRWMRGLLHVIARNSSAIWMRQGVRGLWTLPYAYVIAIRRVILVPIVVYAAMVAIIDPSALFLRGGAAVGAVLIGPAFLMTVAILVIYRRLDLVPFIPAYLGLRVIRAYIGLDMLFTLPLKETVPRSQPARDGQVVRRSAYASGGRGLELSARLRQASEHLPQKRRP